MKNTKKFIYKTTVSWIEEKKGLLSASGKPTIEVAIPPEFKGHKGIWTPEDLFVASINSCVMTTFLYYAERKKLDFISYESEVNGVLEILGNQFMFSEINIRPKIVVPSTDQIKKAKRLIELAEKNCLISNSTKCKVKVIPEITETKGDS